MKIGVFGGSFDPVHRGHVNLAKSVYEKLSLDKMIIIPARVSPFKKDAPPIAKVDERLDMLKISFADMRSFEISMIECRREGVSYTIDTVRELKKIYPHDELYLILTSESFSSFATWKNFEEILTLVKIAVAYDKTKDQPLTPTEVIAVPIDWISINSTYLREELFLGKRPNHYLLPKVLDYILSHRIYSSHYDDNN